MRHPLISALTAVWIGIAAPAAAQPEAPTDPWPEEAGDETGDPGDEGAVDPESPGGDPDPGAVTPGEVVDDPAATAAGAATPAPLVASDDEPPPAAPIEPKLELPVMFNGATARLLPAGVILSSFGVDTGGSYSSDLRIGLGDVAEFGIGTTDLIRVGRNCSPSCDYEGVSPYPLALFKMGVSENRLFTHQPALALGFRKSFERDHDGRSTRIAELYLVASKRLGPAVQLHAGGVFWDASIKEGDDEVLLHDDGIKKQLRAFGGIELEPLPKSQLMLELVWVPEFRIGAGDLHDSIKLRPMFAWGVRYELADWAMVESGVRIPDIGDINLLDAQIFAQVKLVSRRFSRFLEGINR